jgi:hypothetical protein
MIFRKKIIIKNIKTKVDVKIKFQVIKLKKKLNKIYSN